MNSIPQLPKTNSKGDLKVSNNYNQVDGFSVPERGSGSLIVGKMLKLTIDGKYKADKTEILPDNSILVAMDVTTVWVKWNDSKPIEHRITHPG